MAASIFASIRNTTFKPGCSNSQLEQRLARNKRKLEGRFYRRLEIRMLLILRSLR